MKTPLKLISIIAMLTCSSCRSKKEQNGPAEHQKDALTKPINANEIIEFAFDTTDHKINTQSSSNINKSENNRD